MLGISSYFQDLDYDYLEEASKRGAKMIFTSLHIPEEDYSNLDTMLPLFLDKCKQLDLELVPDVSPRTFEKLNIRENDFDALKALGFTSLRLDHTVEDFEELKSLLSDFKLILNASTLSEEYIISAKQANVDFSNISVMHNFYPKKDTGISESYFAALNDVFIRHNIEIMAFVPGDDLKRFPLYQGLPTVEKHRNMHPFVSAVELIFKYNVKNILIGDSKARLTTLEAIQKYMDCKVLQIPAHFDKEYEHLYTQFKPRPDLADYVVRLSVPRVSDIPIKCNNHRPLGSITIENKLAGRYSGEMQITKVPMEMSATSNVVGFIPTTYLDLLEYIDKDTTIEFIEL